MEDLEEMSGIICLGVSPFSSQPPKTANSFDGLWAIPQEIRLNPNFLGKMAWTTDFPNNCPDRSFLLDVVPLSREVEQSRRVYLCLDFAVQII